MLKLGIGTRKCAHLVLLISFALLFAHVSKVTQAIGLRSFLNLLPKGKSASLQLDNYLVGSSGSRELEDNLKALEKLMQSSASKKNFQLYEAAETFYKLRNIREGVCQSDNLGALASIRELLVRDFGASFHADNSRRLVRLFNDALRSHVKACLAKSQRDWSKFNVADLESQKASSSDGDSDAGEQVVELGPAPGIHEQTLGKLHEELKDLMCKHAYKGSRLSISAFECALQESEASLNDQEGAFDIFQTIEAVLLMRDEQAQTGVNHNLHKLYQATSVEEIDALVEGTVRNSCQLLVDSAEVQQTLAPVVGASKLVPVLADDLFLDLSQETDRLLDWSSRFIVCKRLLELTDRNQLNEGILHWAGSHRARTSPNN